jgi:hypothetical protein
MLSKLTPFLQAGTEVLEQEHYVEIPLESTTPGLAANVYYFNHPE